MEVNIKGIMSTDMSKDIQAILKRLESIEESHKSLSEEVQKRQTHSESDGMRSEEESTGDPPNDNSEECEEEGGSTRNSKRFKGLQGTVVPQKEVSSLTTIQSQILDGSKRC